MKKIEYNFCWKRPYSVYYGAAAAVSGKNWVEDEVSHSVAVREDALSTWVCAYFEKNALKQAITHLRKMLEENPGFLKAELEKTRECGTAFIKFSKTIQFTDKTPTEELISYHAKFYEHLVDYAFYLWKSFYLIEAASELFEKFLEKKLAKKDVPQAIIAYSKPSEKTGVLLMLDFFQKEGSEGKRVEFIEKKFPWIGSADPFDPPLNRKQMLEYAKSFKPMKAGANADFGLENEGGVKTFQEMLFVKDKKDEYRREAFYNASGLMKELSKRLGVSLSELGYLLPSDFEGFKGKKEEKIELMRKIEERKLGCTIEVIEKNFSITGGKNVAAQFIENKNALVNREVKGISCCKGVSRGVARVLLTKNDIREFKAGSILVATTTNAGYLPAMQKAAAFVTDEGGITCHAAIVSRELNKPCIVGCKNATRVLKNGDLIEVNANEGIVRIIKSK